jgi:CHAD domain-containing protein
MTAERLPDLISAGDEGPREIEWQLSAPDLGLVRKWLGDHGSVDGLTIEPRPTHTIDDTYLDTEDWRLRRAGLALRLRDVAGRPEATLKDLAPASGSVRIRREFNEPLPSAEFDAVAVGSGPVSSRVHAVAGLEPLKALFRVRTQRERFAALEQGDHEAAEIALDDTVVATPDGGSSARLARVEVEALTGTPASLESLVDHLQSECALTPAAESKYEVGLKIAGLEQPVSPELGSVRIHPSLSAGEVGCSNLRRHLATWLEHEPSARLGEDPEELHELRVAGRRIETTLRVFEPYLPKTLISQRPAWKTLIRTLGAVRDLDVQLARLTGFAGELRGSDAEQLAPLRERLMNERHAARSRMLDMLDRPSTRRLICRLRGALARSEPVRVRVDNPVAAVVAPKLIRRSFRKVRRAAQVLRKDGSASAHHALRRRAKRLRYTLEAFDGFYGREAAGLLQAIRRLLKSLGSNQDAHVAAARFRAMAGSRGSRLPTGTAFWMGVLAERQTSVGADAGRRVQKRYAKLHGRRWKVLRRAMDELETAYAASADRIRSLAPVRRPERSRGTPPVSG